MKKTNQKVAIKKVALREITKEDYIKAFEKACASSEELADPSIFAATVYVQGSIRTSITIYRNLDLVVSYDSEFDKRLKLTMEEYDKLARIYIKKFKELENDKKAYIEEIKRKGDLDICSYVD